MTKIWISLAGISLRCLVLHRRKTQNWARVFFPVLGLFGCLMAPAIVLAAGTWQWTAQLTGNGLPVLGPFATKEQAVQALETAAVQRCASLGIPCPAEATMQEIGVSKMTPNSKTYFYNPITPSTPTVWSCYAWTSNPAPGPYQMILGISGCYADEASAVAAQTSMPGCSSTPFAANGWVTPAGNWSSQLLAGLNPGYPVPVPIIEGTTKTYNQYAQNPPNCATTLVGTELLWRTRGATCPQNYSPMIGGGGYYQTVPGNDTMCQGPINGNVTGNLSECAANAGPSTLVGDPCDVATGDFTQTEPDYSAAGLNFTRTYHSLTLESRMGVGWTHNYASHLVISSGVPTGLMRPDGHDDAVFSTSTSGVYISLSGAAIHVQQSGTNWVATLKDGSSEVYNSTGQLTQLVTPGGMITTLTYNSNNQLSSVSGPFGQSLQFSYNTNNQIQQVIDPAGHIIFYAYDGNNNLTSATYQDSTVRTYLYENSAFPNNLTGILDENNNRFLTVAYDSTTGAVRSSQQAGGAQAVSIVYNTNTAVVTDSLGAINTYTFTTDTAFAPRVNAFSRNSLNQSFTVPAGATDPQRRVTQSTDANGNITTFTYDNDHLTSKTEAYGTPRARTTSYQYLATTSALPTLITEPLRQTAYAYYPGTNTVHTKTITDPATSTSRTWTYTYNGYGQILTIDGPRTDVSDVTTYTYYTCTTGNQCGQIDTVANALSQTTTFNTYNAHGQPLTITDPNGVVTTLSYDARQRVMSRQVGTETTGYSYYPTGLLKTVTLPDSSTITYTYDGAHRLTDVTDGLGNHTHYALDAMGNRTADQTYDPSNALRRTHTRVINALNELYQDINAAGTAAVTTTFGYDNNGNLTSNDAPLSRNTANLYDELNRIKQTTNPASGVTQFTYDANDQLLTVTDPRTLQTTYTRNGFGDVTHLTSPDTGSSTKTYDSGGNLKTTNDARGALGTYSYDALNRVTQVAYSDQSISYTYDAGTNGKGRLTGASDANHSMSWTYDAQGRVTGKSQIVASITRSVGYGYTNGDMTSLVTPSGQTLTYSYTDHRITSIKVNSTTLLSGVTYDPFGPATGWTWGNGTIVSRTFDQDGNPYQFVTAGVTNGYTVDNASRITGISDSGLSSESFVYGYDSLDRLTSGISSAITRVYTYDANGNMLTSTGNTMINATISPTSNRIAALSGSPNNRTYYYDAAGNTTLFTGSNFGFNQRGRVSSRTVSTGTTYYIYNALGQLIDKNGLGGTTLLVYDEAGHILGEYSSTGAMVQETVWMDDTPVAMLRPSGSSVAIYYVHSDHLGTPRKITRATDNVLMWRWDPDTFGSQQANQNPSGQGTFVYNPRFAGQIYLGESALHYNGFRMYDPYVDRYLQSDPIGLAGGVNTYLYSSGNPLSGIDPLGLWSTQAHNKIIDTAFPSLSDAAIQAIKDGSAAVDAAIFQLLGDPAQHAMSQPGEDPNAARNRACDFVNARLARYNQMVGSTEGSVQYMAYFELGEAMHTIMDSTSPAHSGFKTWSIMHPGGHGDLPGSIEDLAHLTPQLLQDTVNKMNGVIKGLNCDCSL